ncbi:hypothetical protein [Sphingosinicella sp. LY1275]|uniref:hypothetical protein n=1 Tax=Sphingosinicella sp. LY1275 TaxID=3095379 RepID=UPI002ADEED73|nr:hypothetical protein [Sphingosinicella sp. LY1275]MEA1015160.1 hypothetical protein [Sphingosinicella sp. LY1275]
MIDLLSTSQILLRDGGFAVRLASIDQRPVVCFEDDALFGFCSAFEQPDELMNGWKLFERQILSRFAPNIRAAGEKAWNVYCVLLCGGPATTVQKRAVSWIEEDLERTRKIAGCDIASREDLVRVLLPLLPIQYQPALEPEDLTARLQKRIADIAPLAAHAMLDGDVPVDEAVRLLGERP